MHEHDDATPNVKVMLFAVGGAALAALALVMSRRKDRDEAELQARAQATAEEIKKEAKKVAKDAKKKQKEMAEAAAAAGERLAEEAREKAAGIHVDTEATERELKAAAWDAQQKLREAENRLRSAGHRVVDDASHLASRVGAEARSLAGEGKERLSHLRHGDATEIPMEREIERLRAEIDELKAQLGRGGRKAERDYQGLASELAARFGGKGGLFSEAMASQAGAAALAQVERALRDKAPALLAAKNRAQVIEILQRELGPTLRDAAVQAAAAALGLLETGRERGDAAYDRARDVVADIRHKAEDAGDEVQSAAREAADEAVERAEAVRADGKRRFWRAAHDAREASETAAEEVSDRVDAAEMTEPAQARRGKAGLFWGGAGLGLALYALLDAERREKVLQLANEASVQIQELVRDLQGYDDEF